jgi:hypothetical protein
MAAATGGAGRGHRRADARRIRFAAGSWTRQRWGRTTRQHGAAACSGCGKGGVGRRGSSDGGGGQTAEWPPHSGGSSPSTGEIRGRAGQIVAGGGFRAWATVTMSMGTRLLPQPFGD